MRTVVLSKKASQKLEALLEYFETEWSAKVKEDFIGKLDKSLDLI
jgi:plasmid stabilization system protein ParE